MKINPLEIINLIACSVISFNLVSRNFTKPPTPIVRIFCYLFAVSSASIALKILIGTYQNTDPLEVLFNSFVACYVYTLKGDLTK